MTLHVIGTGSAGNCYVLDAEDSILLLDAGLPLPQIRQGVREWKSVVGCVVTHEHKDHARSATELAKRGIPVAMSRGTMEGIAAADRRASYIFQAYPDRPSGRMFKMGGFTILPFQVEHDARDPQGFIIRYDKTGEQILYATDTGYIRYKFPGTHYWLIECNYCDDIMDNQMVDGVISPAMGGRLATTHMSLDMLKELFQANNLAETRQILICHLSDTRSDEARMVSEIREVTGKPTAAAQAGLSIQLNLTPF